MPAERIATAAIRLRGRTFTGISHKVAVHAAAVALGRRAERIWEALAPRDFGFLTTTGRFVGRAAAWTIAIRRGQVPRPNAPASGRPELHSEDLY